LFPDTSILISCQDNNFDFSIMGFSFWCCRLGGWVCANCKGCVAKRFQMRLQQSGFLVSGPSRSPLGWLQSRTTWRKLLCKSSWLEEKFACGQRQLMLQLFTKQYGLEHQQVHLQSKTSSSRVMLRKWNLIWIFSTYFQEPLIKLLRIQPAFKIYNRCPLIHMKE